MIKRKSKRILPAFLLQPVFWQKLFFFWLPFQLGKFIWFPFSNFFGLRLDYLAGAVYATDLIGLGWLASFLLTKNSRKMVWFRLNSFTGWWGMTILILAGMRIFGVLEPGLFLLTWLRVGWFFVWYLTISTQEIDWKQGIIFLKISIGIVGLLALVQVWQGGSIQGLFWWLGERELNAHQAGIARFSFAGRNWLRPYATFSHPNNLAGFFLISAAWLGELGQAWLNWWMVLTGVVIGLGFSRPAWLVGGWWLGLFLMKNKKNRGWLVLLVGLAFLAYLVYPPGELSFLRRESLSQCGWELIKGQEWRGIGWGQFFPELARCRTINYQTRFFQPIHNVFLLTLVESGWLLTGMIGVWLIGEYRRWNLGGRRLFWLVAFLGLWDHYLLTAIQLRYLVVLILCWARADFLKTQR